MLCKLVIKQNEALRSRMIRYISENPKQDPERREAAKKRLETNQATYEKKRGRKKGASRTTWH